ncbi:hypothetical protein FQN50_002200 [Emmonsiellopsis sp. PD_5]|nr:hypothetical protein FQN50_002200 [Emmonsiellopsis sp. PD_5]
MSHISCICCLKQQKKVSFNATKWYCLTSELPPSPNCNQLMVLQKKAYCEQAHTAECMGAELCHYCKVMSPASKAWKDEKFVWERKKKNDRGNEEHLMCNFISLELGEGRTMQLIVEVIISVKEEAWEGIRESEKV